MNYFLSPGFKPLNSRRGLQKLRRSSRLCSKIINEIKSPVAKVKVPSTNVEVKRYKKIELENKIVESPSKNHNKRIRSVSPPSQHSTKRSKNDNESMVSQKIKNVKANSTSVTKSNVNKNSTVRLDNRVANNVGKNSANSLGKNSTSSVGKSSTSSLGKNSTNSSTVSNDSKSKLCCDRCDGKHDTKDCPYYRKARDNHPDAQKRKNNGYISTLPGMWLKSIDIKVYRQPGDGSCLFHSMSFGLNDGSSATSLRKDICNYIMSNPNIKICDTPLKSWIRWDTNSNVVEYVRKMYRGSWGGGIEMACVSIIKKVNIHVYQSYPKGYKRISAFDYPIEPEKRKIVRVLYQGRCHYDALKVL